MKRRIEGLRNALQSAMLQQGARLPGLETRQNWVKRRNNNSSGKDYPDTEEGITHMKNQQQSTESEKNEAVTPAGGVSDNDAVNRFVKTVGSVVRGEDGSVSINVNKSYSRIALEVAIPTTVIVGGIVVGVAALVVIDNKWGGGARANKLIERGVFDKPLLIEGTDGSLTAAATQS